MYRFLYDAADAAMIDGWGLKPDPELVKRNAIRAHKVIASMEPKWCLYNPRTTAKYYIGSVIGGYEPTEEEEGAFQEMERAAHSHTEE